MDRLTTEETTGRASVQQGQTDSKKNSKSSMYRVAYGLSSVVVGPIVLCVNPILFDEGLSPFPSKYKFSPFHLILLKCVTTWSSFRLKVERQTADQSQPSGCWFSRPIGQMLSRA